MFTVLVFVIQTIHGLASYENSTHVDSVHPEHNKYDMQVYGVSSEPSVDLYPAEKTSEYKKVSFNGFCIIKLPSYGYSLCIFLVYSFTSLISLASSIIEKTYFVQMRNVSTKLVHMVHMMFLF